MAREPLFKPKFHQTRGIGRIFRPNDQQHIHLGTKRQNSSLAVPRRIAKVARFRANNMRKTFFKRIDNLARFGYRKRRLRDIGKLLIFWNLYHFSIGLVTNERNRTFRELTKRPNHLGMARMPNQDDMATRIEMSFCTKMNLEHQRATGVKNLQMTRFSLFVNAFGDTMSRENHYGSFGDLIQFINKNNALALKRFHNKLIMHNFMADIYRRTEFFDSFFNHMNSAVNASTESTRGSQNEFFHNSPNLL